MRRKLSSILTLVVATTVLAGCTTEALSGKSDDASQRISVSLAEGVHTNQIRAMLPEFETATGIKVDLNVLGLDQLSTQYQVKLNTQSSDLDVIYFRPLQETRLFADNGWLADLTTKVSEDAEWNWEDFTPSSIAAATAESKVYGVPVMTEREIIFYNKEILADKGIDVPTTMDELKAAAEALHDPQNNQFGISMRGTANSAVPPFSGFLYSFGGDWMDENRNATIDTPEAIAAFDYYGSLLRNYGPRGVASVDGAQARSIFMNGQAAIFIGEDSAAGLIEDPAESQVAGKVGYAEFPSGPHGSLPWDITPWAVGVSAFSTKTEAAWTYVKWATSPEVLNASMKDSTSPSPRQSSWENPEITEGFNPELVTIIRSYADRAVGYDRPLVIEVGMVRDIVGAPIITAINAGDVVAAAAKANKDFQDYLDTES
ncbi:MAG: extracellular solute-binding protein [Propionibacteriaceae bacterium]|jgi:multiple sugar transport system substrate-binding protein|nr:extracellular solute-binding protein [Propionibacteriaceae bacterium]